MIVQIGNEDVEVNAKGAGAIEAIIESVEQIGFKKYITANINYTDKEDAEKNSQEGIDQCIDKFGLTGRSGIQGKNQQLYTA